MAAEIAAFIFEKARSVVFDAVKKQVSYETEDFFTKLKIQNELEKSVARVVEPLVPFLNNEKVSEVQQRLLVEVCTSELHQLIEHPSRLFEASLDGAKVFERLYKDKELPAAIREEGLQGTYSLLLPRIANLICTFPPAVKAWQLEGWKEGFRRLDEISDILRGVGRKVDELVGQPAVETDDVLSRIRQSLIQSVQFKLELTGLRPDRPIEPGRIEDLFVLPSIKRLLANGLEESIEEPARMRKTFLCWRCRHIVIGQPGSGKTTWAEWLQNEYLSKPDGRLGIVIRLRDLLVANRPSLQQLVRAAGGQHLAEEVEPKHIRKWLDTGRVALIFDGFDEIAPSDRDAMVEWLNDLETSAGTSAIIVTSRPLTGDHLDRLCKFKDRWEIQSFDDDRVIEYIGRWYRFSPLLREDQRQVDASSLGSTWLNDSVIGPLTENPLVLTTLLVVHHLDGDLPKGRARLYERYVEGMLGLWDDKRKVSAAAVNITRFQKHRILIRVALHFQLSGIDQLDEQPMIEFVEEVLEESHIACTGADVLAVLRERTGLLIGPGSYSFVHKSVSEFLVAQAVFQGDQQDEMGEHIDRMRLFKDRNDDRWNTVLFFWAGLTTLADLRDFIDRSLEVLGPGDWELAWGLLYDQLERLPTEWARRAVIRLLENPPPPHGVGGGVFALQPLECFPPDLDPTNLKPDDNEVAILSPHSVRGLSAVAFESTLSALLSATGLGFQNLLRVSSWLFLPVWLQQVAYPKDRNAYRDALSFRSEDRLPSTYQLFALIRIRVLIEGNASQQEVDDAINDYETAFPTYVGIVPLFALQQVLKTILASVELISRPKANWPREKLKQWLRGFRVFRGSRVNEEWLKGSAKMGFALRRPPVDLLVSFGDALDKAIGAGLAPDDEYVASARAWVAELITERSRLLSKI